MISIHALREEGDKLVATSLLPTPYFYPRPPRGGRLKYISTSSTLYSISIHALREEGDYRENKRLMEELISIHALREEGDTDL